MRHICAAHTLVITTLSKDVEFAFWCMFACEDFKELNEGPSGTEKKVAGGKRGGTNVWGWNAACSQFLEEPKCFWVKTLEDAVLCVHCVVLYANCEEVPTLMCLEHFYGLFMNEVSQQFVWKPFQGKHFHNIPWGVDARFFSILGYNAFVSGWQNCHHNHSAINFLVCWK